MIDIHPTARISPKAKLEVGEGRIGADVVIGDDCVIRAQELVLEPGAQLGRGVFVDSRRFTAGYGTRLAAECRFSAVRKPADEISIGDYCYFGEANVVLIPRFMVGDYVAIHHHLLANGYEDCTIGHNCWIGQNCVLNSTKRLTIGNNVGLGAYSSVYTHAFNGELLEGCNVFNEAPVVIEDNVWIVGSYNVISPGVTLGKRSMVLTSSVVSKSVLPAHCVGGVPAVDLTARITPFRDVTIDEKLTMMRRFIAELAAERYPDDASEIDGGFLLGEHAGRPWRLLVAERASDVALDTGVVYAAVSDAFADAPNITVFDVTTKQYAKKRHPAELEAIQFMNGYRARFVPSDRPTIL